MPTDPTTATELLAEIVPFINDFGLMMFVIAGGIVAIAMFAFRRANRGVR